MLTGRDVPKSHEHRIAWMVVGLVEIDELLVSQIRDRVRLTTAIEMVCRRREQIPAHGLP